MIRRLALSLTLLGLVACDRSPTAEVRADAPRPGEGPAASPATATSSVDIHLDLKLIETGRVRTAPAESAALAAQLELPGEVIPAADGEAEVGSIVAGRVVELSAAEGDRVDKGQVLARIESSELGRASADLQRARARAEVADKKLARQLDLQKQGATSATAVDEARADAAVARADLLAARTLMATLGTAEPSGGSAAVRLALRSPIAGIVVRRSASLGAPVSPDASLFRVVAPDRLLVRARLPETSPLSPKVGERARVHPRARRAETAEGCDAVVSSSFGIIDEVTRSAPILLRLEGPCAFLLPGAYVDVLLRGDPRAGGRSPEASGVVVPGEAIVDVRGAPTIFVAHGGPATFQARRVRPGVAEGGLVRVEAGVEVGEQVVISGAILLKGEMMRAELGGE